MEEEILVSPHPGEPLTPSGDDLVSPGGERYPVRGGIARLVEDEPQTIEAVEAWCRETGLVDVCVRYGGNGIELTGRRP